MTADVPERSFTLLRTGLMVLCLGGCHGHAPAPVQPILGLTWPVFTREAEVAQLGGSAAIVGAPDQSDRARGDLGGEASGRQAVLLTQGGDSLRWTVQLLETGTNALVVRFSVPDAPGGGGSNENLTLTVQDPSGNVRLQRSLQLSSRYAWLYGGVPDGTKLFNVPANAATYATASDPMHLYDEIQLHLGNASLAAGDVIQLTRNAGPPSRIAVDFIELEVVPEPLKQPSGFLSLTDPACGAVPLDVHQTHEVFDGVDDSSYGSQFIAAMGNNPHNPSSFAVVEKDYYASAPGDVLQDSLPNPLASGMTLFQLADHNLQSLQTCIALAAASGGTYAGVFVPAGRFYARGVVELPSGITVQGAGMWYSKFTAVDDAPPASVTVNGVSGIASVSGNLIFTSTAGASDSVQLSNLSIFGNVTQRDTVDATLPHGVIGAFTHSAFDNLWVEHVFSGIKLNGASSGVTFSNDRARDTFADGIAFYGSTSNSTIKRCQSRSTGDDGFALWSQGATLDSISHGNQAESSTALLQWYGNGFAVYGGTGSTLSSIAAADILNYPCVQLSTQFVPAALPATASMSASLSDATLSRCGGNGFDEQFGALLLGTDVENVDGISIRGVEIYEPTYSAIDIRPIPVPPDHLVAASFSNVSLDALDIIGAPTCLSVRPYSGGSIRLDEVCACAATSSTAEVCSPTNASEGTFQIDSGSCEASTCTAP